MRKHLLLFLILLLSLAFTSNPDDEKTLKIKSDESRYTDVGNIGLSVTNFGMYGSGWVNWPDVPSCEYPIGSGIEHLFAGGLWVGGFTKNNTVGVKKVHLYQPPLLMPQL